MNEETPASAPGPETAVNGQPKGGAPSAALPTRPVFKSVWLPLAVLLLAIAVSLSVFVALATGASAAHRAVAALAALLDVAALAALAHVTLIQYQSRIASTAGAGQGPQTMLEFRRRGLKGAVMGEDGRTSTSKTQVVVWTGAVVWALIDLLVLARAYPRGSLSSAANGNNWRPEYLALLGLPSAAAATVKAAVVGSNNGLGPQEGTPADAAQKLQLPRVYVRNPVPDRKDMQGVTKGMAELITSDDGSVAWADLQYVVFTLVTMVYFGAQVVSQPSNGLPPVPAALLTLMGVSAGAYTANKIVETRGAAPIASAAPTHS